jgi:hypothetical protein
MSGVSNVLQIIHRFPESAGAMGNAQCPLIQFPYTHYFLSGLWDQGYLNRSREAVLKDVSAQLYPENAQFVADCFAALKATNPGQINALADRLQKLIKEDRLGRPGVYGRKLFPNPNLVADSLLMQLRLRAAEQRLFQACGASPTANELRQLLTTAFDAYLTWDKAHGWHDLWGTGWPQNENPIFGDRRLPRLLACIRGAAGGNEPVEALLAQVAQTLSAHHAESQVRTYCTEPMKRLARMPEPVRSLAQKAVATASVVPKPEQYPARYAVDGNWETLYWPGVLVTNNHEWLQLTWPELQTIRKGSVHFLKHPSMTGRTIHWQRESSPGAWQDFATAVIPDDPLTSHAVANFELSSPVTLDKLRIVNLLDLYEVELY